MDKPNKNTIIKAIMDNEEKIAKHFVVGLIKMQSLPETESIVFPKGLFEQEDFKVILLTVAKRVDIARKREFKALMANKKSLEKQLKQLL